MELSWWESASFDDGEGVSALVTGRVIKYACISLLLIYVICIQFAYIIHKFCGETPPFSN